MDMGVSEFSSTKLDRGKHALEFLNLSQRYVDLMQNFPVLPVDFQIGWSIISVG